MQIYKYSIPLLVIEFFLWGIPAYPARAKRARAVKERQSPTVGLGKDFQIKTDSCAQMALTRKRKEILCWAQAVKGSSRIGQQTPC